MANFTGMKLTSLGSEILGLLGVGEDKLTFTRAAVGSGKWTTAQQESPKTMTALVEERMDLSINSIAAVESDADSDQPSGAYIMRVALTNAGLETGFYLRELGVFATHPTRGEVLFEVTYAGDDEYDYIPAAASGVATLEKQFNITVATGDASEVTITMSSVLFALQDDITDHNTDPEAHPDLLAQLACGTSAILTPADDAKVGETPLYTFEQFVAVIANTEESAIQLQVQEAGGNWIGLIHDTGWLTTIANGYELPAGLLTAGSVEYESRVRRRLKSGLISNWSDIVLMTTKESFVEVARPTDIPPSSGASNVGRTPTFICSDFDVTSTDLSPDPEFTQDGSAGGWLFTGDSYPTISGGLLDFSAAAQYGGVYIEDNDLSDEGKVWRAKVVVDSITTGSIQVYAAENSTDGDTTENLAVIDAAGTHWVTVESDADSTMLGLQQASEDCDAVVSELSLYEFDTHVATYGFVLQDGAVLYATGDLGPVNQFTLPAGYHQTGKEYSYQFQHEGARHGLSEKSIPTTYYTAAAFIEGDEAVTFSAWADYEDASSAGVALASNAALYSNGVDQDTGDGDWVSSQSTLKIRDPGLSVTAGTTADTLKTEKAVTSGDKLITDSGSCTAGDVSMEESSIIVDHIPTMDAETTDGCTMTASTYLSGYTPWRAGNKDWSSESNCWLSAAGIPFPHTLYISFEEAKSVAGYAITYGPGTSAAANGGQFTAWNFLGRNSGGDWQTLDSVSGQTTWVLSERREFALDESVRYDEYALVLLSNTGATNYAVLGEIELLGPDQLIYSTDISAAGFTEAPTKAHKQPTLMVATGAEGADFTADDFSEIDIDSATLGTDTDADRPDFMLLTSAKTTPAETFRRVAIGVSSLPEDAECRITETQCDTWMEA